MRLLGAFELDIQPGTPDASATVRIALLRYARSEDGRLFTTPECSSFKEIEGQINSLQDELDEIRERARRVLQAARYFLSAASVFRPCTRSPTLDLSSRRQGSGLASQ